MFLPFPLLQEKEKKKGVTLPDFQEDVMSISKKKGKENDSSKQ